MTRPASTATACLVNDSILTCEKARGRARSTCRPRRCAPSPVLNSGLSRPSTPSVPHSTSIPAPRHAAAHSAGPEHRHRGGASSLPVGGTSYNAGRQRPRTRYCPHRAWRRKRRSCSSPTATTPLVAPCRPTPFPRHGCAGVRHRSRHLFERHAITMNQVAALGAPGSSCTQVTNLSVLDDVIGEQLGSTLSALQISVDGGVPIPDHQHHPGTAAGRPRDRELLGSGDTCERRPRGVCLRDRR